MDGLDARSRRSSRHIPAEGSYTPQHTARSALRASDCESLSLVQLAAGVAGLSNQAERVAQKRGEDTRSTLQSMEQLSNNIAAAMDSRTVSVAEARRRASSAAGGTARSGPVSAADLEEAARAMVDGWLEPRGLAQYAERIIFAFQEAAYRPHEWTHTLESMGPDELREFISAVEKSPAPNEAEMDGGRARRRSRERSRGSVSGPCTASAGLSETLAEATRISDPKAGRRAGGARGTRRDPCDTYRGEAEPGRRGGQDMEAVPRAAGPRRETGGPVTGSAPRAGRRAAVAAAAAAANRGRRAAALAGQAR